MTASFRELENTGKGGLRATLREGCPPDKVQRKTGKGDKANGKKELNKLLGM